LIPFLLFDINKFMSEEHLQGVSSCGQLGEPPKRRRTPSQYATQIADFKNVPDPIIQNLTITSKRTRTIKFAEPNDVPEENGNSPPAKPLLCTLPNGKQYALKIVIETNKSILREKSVRRKLKKAESMTSNKGK
jgi:hypothetical protein